MSDDVKCKPHGDGVHKLKRHYLGDTSVMSYFCLQPVSTNDWPRANDQKCIPTKLLAYPMFFGKALMKLVAPQPDPIITTFACCSSLTCVEHHVCTGG